jgi:hypothetical protein
MILIGAFGFFWFGKSPAPYRYRHRHRWSVVIPQVFRDTETAERLYWRNPAAAAYLSRGVPTGTEERPEAGLTRHMIRHLIDPFI